MSCNMDRISSKIISCVKEYSGHNEIDMNTSLKDDLGLDSLDCTEMLMIIEEKFNIDSADVVLRVEMCKTVGDFVNTIKTQYAIKQIKREIVSTRNVNSR